MKTYLTRSIEPVLEKAARQFPVVVLTGPRQSGKTTTLEHLFAGSHRYVSLEPPDVRAAAEADPRGFIQLHRPPVIFDEVQYAPDLLFYIKEEVDAHRDRPGQYLLTGSQNLLLHERVTESLAGRAAMLKLLPLTFRERRGDPEAPLPWERLELSADQQRASLDCPLIGEELWSAFLRGGYPEIAVDAERDEALWMSSYVQTYLERDVRSLRQIGSLTQFRSFLRLVAANSAQLLNLTSMSRELGVAVNTIKQWLSLLEATYQVVVLRPYSANIGKRLVKTPKVYLSDVGLLCHLVGITDIDQALNGPMRGAIMETAVVTEVLHTFLHRGVEPSLHFWRTATGVEVDLLVESGTSLIPLEVKSTATPSPTMAKGIRSLRADLEEKVRQGYLIHAGDVTLPLGGDVVAWPFCAL